MKKINKFLGSLAACAAMLGGVSTQAVAADINIIPVPVKTQVQKGEFVLPQKVVISYQAADGKNIAEYMADKLKASTGYDVTVGGKKGNISIQISHSMKMAEEGYRLTVTSKGVVIKAKTGKGAFYGMQSFMQLLPAQVESATKVSGVKWVAQCCDIQDAPRFGYRGFHLDPCRHFITVENVKKQLDIMSMFKVNTMHFHLTEDQGWRIEIKKYPKLTTVGGYRKKTIVGYMWDNPTEWYTKRYGGFYTQEDIKEVVAYAKKRFVEIIPEIEMPGHSVAALTAYPEYSCTGGPFEVEGRWGVFNDIYCTKESTFTFMQDILDEVVKLFPSSYIHLGGDEAPRIRWKNCVHCQERMKQEHLTKEAELQTYFINRIENYLNTRGKKIIGWDEILEGGIPQRATVMSWRGEKGGIHAAKAGYDVIMSPNIYMYFNCFQFKGNGRKIGNPNRVITLEKVYNYHPVPEALTADEAKHIKGVQANLWTEYMSALDEMEYMLYPRVAALSEVAWSKKEHKDYGKFCTRLEGIRQHYDVLGINYCKKISNE